MRAELPRYTYAHGRRRMPALSLTRIWHSFRSTSENSFGRKFSPTKCWLRSTGEPSTGNTYSEWVKTQNDSYRTIGTERLLAEFPKDEVVLSPDIENVKGARWRLASSFAVRAQMDSCVLESELHVVECRPAEGRGKPVQFIPTHFLFTNKLSKDNKLLLALDAFVALEIAETFEVSVGRIIHGDDHATLKVKTSAMTSEVRKRIEKITALLANSRPPDLVLNSHCAGCRLPPGACAR